MSRWRPKPFEIAPGAILALLVAVAVVASGCSRHAAQGAAERPGGFRTYHDAAKGFSITFPADWEQRGGLKETAIAAISPAGGPRDAFRENAAVVVEELPEGTTLDDYDRASHEKIRAFLKAHDYKELEHARVRLGDVEAARLVYSHRKDDFPLKLITWLAVRGNRGYVICCGSTPGEFDRYLPVFEQIGNSFTLH